MVSNKARDNLIGKLVDGARATYELFEAMRNDRACSPVELSRDLSERYGLTDSQREYIDRVAERGDRAIGIMRYLEERFGLEEGPKTDNDRLDEIYSLRFRDPEGLFRLITGRKPTKDLSAYSHNMVMSFVKPRWNFKNARGVVLGDRTGYDQLDVPLEDTLKRLDRDMSTNCCVLGFEIPTFDYYLRKVGKNDGWKLHQTAEVKILESLFGSFTDEEIAAKMMEETTSHEVRHVIDSIISEGGDVSKVYVETQAELYDGDSILRGLFRDQNTQLESIDKKSKNFERGIGLYPGSQIDEYAQRRVEELGRERQNIVEEFNSLDLGKAELLSLANRRALSYFFTFTPRRVVGKRLPHVIRELKNN